MIRRPPRSTRTDNPLSLHDALPILRDANGAPVAEGDTGEITVRSAHVMLGYWRNPELTATTVRDGWLWTGDLARRSEEHTSELQSLMRISYAVFCLKKKKKT